MKIDLVYLWVDINDPQYIQKNSKYLNQHQRKPHEGRSVDELKYSLRSVYKHMPWINNIFIITDSQHPKWLNLNNGKVHIIDQSEILPRELEYSMNARAIEICMSKIKDLSEFFLFSNDDMFVNKNLTQDYFFNSKNQPIFSVMKLPFFANNLYNNMLRNANIAIFKKYGKFFFRVPSHNMTPYSKTNFEWIVSESKFAPNFKATMMNPRRNIYDVSRFLINNYMYKENMAEFRKVHFKQELYCNAKTSWLVKFLRPKLFCVNDTIIINERNERHLSKWLEKKFPDKAPWEL